MHWKPRLMVINTESRVYFSVAITSMCCLSPSLSWNVFISVSLSLRCCLSFKQFLGIFKFSLIIDENRRTAVSQLNHSLRRTMIFGQTTSLRPSVIISGHTNALHLFMHTMSLTSSVCVCVVCDWVHVTQPIDDLSHTLRSQSSGHSHCHPLSAIVSHRMKLLKLLTDLRLSAL